jgi:hypothetical protein
MDHPLAGGHTVLALVDKDNPRLDVSAQQSIWQIYREHSLQQGARAHHPGDGTMKTEISSCSRSTLILLTIIVGIVWQTRLAGAVVGPVLINRCVPDYRDPACTRYGWPEAPRLR